VRGDRVGGLVHLAQLGAQGLDVRIDGTVERRGRVIQARCISSSREYTRPGRSTSTFSRRYSVRDRSRVRPRNRIVFFSSSTEMPPARSLRQPEPRVATGAAPCARGPPVRAVKRVSRCSHRHPSSSPTTRSISLERAVRKITGSDASSCCSRLNSSKPFMSGRPTSSTASAAGCCGPRRAHRRQSRTSAARSRRLRARRRSCPQWLARLRRRGCAASLRGGNFQRSVACSSRPAITVRLRPPFSPATVRGRRAARAPSWSRRRPGGDACRESLRSAAAGAVVRRAERPGRTAGRKYQRELLAAVPREQVGRAQLLQPGLGTSAQQRVAGRMAAPVVVALEMVQVEHHQRQGRPLRRARANSTGTASSSVRRFAIPVSPSCWPAATCARSVRCLHAACAKSAGPAAARAPS